MLLLLTSGCVGIFTTWEGNPISKEAMGKIEIGQTTRAQVLEMLGAPLVIETADITALAQQALARYQGEQLTLQIDPALFNDVYIYERSKIDRLILFFGFFNYASSDQRSDRLAIFFDKDGRVEGMGFTPGLGEE